MYKWYTTTCSFLKANIFVSFLICAASYRDQTHDFKILKGERLLPPASIKLADSGYQGWQKLQSNVMIPIKRKKKMPLTKQERLYNTNLSSVRMWVEHVIRRIKILDLLRKSESMVKNG